MTSIDRLKDLKRGGVDSVAIDVSEKNNSSLVQNDVTGGRGGGSSSSGGGGGEQVNAQMSQFFGDVEIVKTNINAIKDATRSISEINQQVVLATSNEREAELSAELTPLIQVNNKKANVAKQLLQRLREDTERMKTSSTGKQSDIRIRENLVSTLTRKFVDVMKDYQNIQTKYKTDIKKKVKRQVQIVKPDATNEEVEAVLKSGGGADQVFQEAILKVKIR
jgi:t-SNARE complex subunit (syntaxin)